MTAYRFSIPYAVRSSDINSAGHVSNAAVMNYLQDGRIAYFAGLGPFTERDVGEGRAILLAEARVRYLAEIFLGDALEIGVRTDEVRNRSFLQSYRIERQGRAVVEATLGIVCFDHREKKAAPLPAAFRDAMMRFEE